MGDLENSFFMSRATSPDREQVSSSIPNTSAQKSTPLNFILERPGSNSGRNSKSEHLQKNSREVFSVMTRQLPPIFPKSFFGMIIETFDAICVVRVLLEKLLVTHLFQEHFLQSWNPKVGYRSRKCPPLVPVLVLTKPVNILTWHILILSSRLSLDLPSTTFTSGISSEFLYELLVSRTSVLSALYKMR
jgi:hypothetical protein